MPDLPVNYSTETAVLYFPGKVLESYFSWNPGLTSSESETPNISKYSWNSCSPLPEWSKNLLRGSHNLKIYGDEPHLDFAILHLTFHQGILAVTIKGQQWCHCNVSGHSRTWPKLDIVPCNIIYRRWQVRGPQWTSLTQGLDSRIWIQL